MLLLKAIVALLFVLGLLFVTLWTVKYIEVNSASGKMFKKLNSKRRLEILEIKRIDSRNALVLVRRDDKEHLLLVGPSCQVVETNIPAPTPKDEGQINEKKA